MISIGSRGYQVTESSKCPGEGNPTSISSGFDVGINSHG